MTPSTVRSLAQAALALSGAFGLLTMLPVSPGPGSAWAQEGASATQDVTLQDVVFRFGDTNVTLPSVLVSGTRLSKDDLRAILTQDGVKPWPTRLARLDAGSLVAPELRVERTVGDVRQLSVYRDVAAKGIHGGRAAELSAAGASLSVEGGPGADKGGGKGFYGKIFGQEVDLAALGRLYGEAGDGKGPFQRIYAAFSIADIAFGDDDTTVKLASLSGRDFAGRQIPATWSGAAEALGAIDFDHGDAIERARASGIAADVLEAVSIGSFEATGFSIKTLKDAAGDLAIGRVAYSGGDANRELTLSDFAFAGSRTRAAIASFKLTGFSFEPTIATLRRLSTSAEASDADMRRLMPVIGTLAFRGLALELPHDDADEATASDDPLGKSSPGKNAPGTSTPGQTSPAKPAEAIHLGLRDAAMTFGAPHDGVPVAGRLTLSGMTLPSSLVAGVPGLGSLALYGYRDLDLDLVADAAWDEAARELTVREASVSGKDLGRLRLNGTLGGIGPEVFDPDPSVSGYAMLSATAKAVDLTIENSGLFERFIDATAKSLSLKPDELRKEYVTASLLGVPVILGNSTAAKAIGAAMGKFVTKPGTLSISTKAKNGAGLGVVDVSTAPTPAAVLDKLDVTAKAE